MSFVPAVVGVLGRAAFWPSLPPTPALIARAPRPDAGGSRRGHGHGCSAGGGPPLSRTALCGAAAAARRGSGLVHARLGTNIVSGLPSSSAPRQAAAAASAGFGPGIVGPATLLLRGPRHCPSGSAAGAPRGRDQVGTPALTPSSDPASCPPVSVDPSSRPRVVMQCVSSSFSSTIRTTLPQSTSFTGVGQPGHACVFSPRKDSVTPRPHRGREQRPHCGGGGLSDRDRHLAHRALRSSPHEHRADGLFPRNPRSVAPNCIECPRPRRIPRHLRRRLPGTARVPRRHLLRPGHRRIAAGVTRRRLQRVRDGPHLGGGARSRHAERRRGCAATGFTSRVDCRGDAGRQLRSARDRARSSVSRVRVHHVGAGVLIDAFVVRTLLLPALLVLAGPRAFWPHRSPGRQVGRR